MVLWSQLVRRHLAATLDQAQTAGVQASIRSTSDGLAVSVLGYSDKLDQILATVVDGALQTPINADAFDIYRRDLIRRYRNTTTTRPIDQVGWAMAEALDPRDWTYAEGADYLEGLTRDDLEAWRQDLFEAVHIEMMVHGNRSADDATTAARMLQERFATASTATPIPLETRRVPKGRDLFRTVEVDHDDSAIRVLYQATDTSLAEQARWLMLGTLLKTPAFTQLRTEQQLGYMVWGRYDRRDSLPGISINIQSGVAGPDVLLERIEVFLDGFGPHLAEMSIENYETVREGLIATLQESPTSLYQRTRDLSVDLGLGVTTFDRKDQIVKLLESVEKSEVESVFMTAIRGDAARRLVVQATGHTHADTPVPEGACTDPSCLADRMDPPFVRQR
jgi:secreted Zn-dependent insulinase-like peptidase